MDVIHDGSTGYDRYNGFMMVQRDMTDILATRTKHSERMTTKISPKKQNDNHKRTRQWISNNKLIPDTIKATYEISTHDKMSSFLTTFS